MKNRDIAVLVSIIIVSVVGSVIFIMALHQNQVNSCAAFGMCEQLGVENPYTKDWGPTEWEQYYRQQLG